MVHFRLILYFNTNISSRTHQHMDEEEQCEKKVAHLLLRRG